MRASRKGIKLGRRLVNKTARVREIAQRMVDEGRPPRPVEIMDAMAAEGVKVTSGQVSLALKGTPLALNAKKPIKFSMADLTKVDALCREIGRERLLAAMETYMRLENDGPAQDADG